MTNLNAERYDALLEAGAGIRKARAAAASFFLFSKLATKTDLAQMETRLMRSMMTMGGIICGVVVGTGGVATAVILVCLP